MKIALVILTYNEYPCLKQIYPAVAAQKETGAYDEVYAIDGGSTDGTLEFYKSIGIPVIGQSRKGRGDAFQQALKHIDADAFLFFSPDGNEDPADLPAFRTHLEKGAEIVIASRMMKGAVNEEDHQLFRWRKWANNGLNFLANLLFKKTGPYITDSINGYRAITKAAMQKLRLDALGYTIEYQMTIRAFKHSMNIIEFPTHEHDRIAGETKAPSIRTGFVFLGCLYSELFKRIDRDEVSQEYGN